MKLLIGSYPAKLDASGRVKIPEKFREVIEETYGKDVVVTSLANEAVQVYPLPVWERMTGANPEMTLSLQPTIRKFLAQVNFQGNHQQLDPKGRVLIKQTLRDKAQLPDEVEVVGMTSHLEIWNKRNLERMLEEKPLTDADFETIAKLLTPRGKPE
jgi:MraZ protein